jgi:hypothetical protein
MALSASGEWPCQSVISPRTLGLRSLYFGPCSLLKRDAASERITKRTHQGQGLRFCDSHKVSRVVQAKHCEKGN